MPSTRIPSAFKVAIEKATMTTSGNQTDKSAQTNGNSRALVLIMKARKMFLSSDHRTKLGRRKSKQSLNFSIGPHQVILGSHSHHVMIHKFLPEGHYFLVFEHVVVPITPSEVTKDVKQKIRINA